MGLHFDFQIVHDGALTLHENIFAAVAMTQPRPQSLHVHELSASNLRPRRVHTRFRVNRPPILWLAARRQGSFALLPFDFHL